MDAPFGDAQSMADPHDFANVARLTHRTVCIKTISRMSVYAKMNVGDALTALFEPLDPLDGARHQGA
jgi:hypothetical protein